MDKLTCISRENQWRLHIKFGHFVPGFASLGYVADQKYYYTKVEIKRLNKLGEERKSNCQEKLYILLFQRKKRGGRFYGKPIFGIGQQNATNIALVF